jgi:hypothetical protein
VRLHFPNKADSSNYKLLFFYFFLLIIAIQLPRASRFVSGLFKNKTKIAAPLISKDKPVLKLRVPTRSYMLLDNLRRQALEKGLLFRSSDDTVSALITHNGRHQKVTARLKGDFVDHFNSEKWSWRVHVGSKGHVLGLRRFSLQAPHTRGHEKEALIFDYLRAEDLIAPRYEFVELWVNGKNQGVMALEEHFSKELLEAQRRREGVIVRFDEDEFWRDRSRNDAILGIGGVGPEKDFSWRDAKIRPFRQAAISKSELLTLHAESAVGMLRALQSKKLTPSEVFDPEIMGRFLAVYEIWGYWHGLRWHNMRFYLNPVTFRLEPVGFDSTSMGPTKNSLFNSRLLIFTRALLGDEQIFNAYRYYLNKLTNSEYLKPRFAALDDLERKLTSQLHHGRKMPPKISQYLSERASNFSQKMIELPSREKIVKTSVTGREVGPVKGEQPYPLLVQAYVIKESPSKYVLELSTPLREMVKVTELNFGSEVKLPISLGPSSFDRAPSIYRIDIPKEIFENPAIISGKAIAPSQPEIEFSFSAEKYFKVADSVVLTDQGNLRSLLSRYLFLKWDGETFNISAGTWKITEPLIIPRRLEIAPGKFVFRPSVNISPGTHLNFSEQAMLITYGALSARGSESNPIKLAGVNGAYWKGLVVLGPKKESFLEYVTIENTKASALRAWRLTGGVSFYETELKLSSVTISDSQAEDALNIIRSRFLMKNVKVSQARSDAVDIDFSNGQIENSTFSDVGGDAIDLSGSEVRGLNLKVNKVHDKAVSVGEESEMILENVQIKNVGTGIVSKDLSSVKGEKIKLADIELAGFMSYSKKPEYGPAKMQVENVEFDESSVLGMAQYDSLLKINGEKISESEVDVENLYSIGPMKK